MVRPQNPPQPPCQEVVGALGYKYIYPIDDLTCLRSPTFQEVLQVATILAAWVRNGEGIRLAIQS